jgi:sodium-dependent dicarboxylate transporter 2/3/5
VPLFATSLFVLLLCLVWLAPVMRAHGIAVEDGVFLSQFFSNVIVLFFGGFVLSAALRHLRLDEWLACQIIRRSGDSIPRLMIGIMGTTAFLSMWLSNTATAAMMLALVIPIAGRLNEGDGYRLALLLSVPLAANIGGLGTPIGSPPNAIAIQYMQQLGLAPGFGQWMLVGVPGAVSMLALAWCLLIVLFRGSENRLPGGAEPPTIPRSPAVVIVTVTAAVTVLGWITTSFHGFSAGTVALLPAVVFFGCGILGIRELRTLSWEVLLLMGGGLCLGTAISESGLAAWLIGLLPERGVSVVALMIGFGTLACVMSSVMSNTATANLVMPIIVGLGIDSPTPIFVGTAFACSLAMPLPVSTPPNAMAFSSGEITVRDMVKPGLALTVVGLLLTFTAGRWWWRWLGIF